MDIDTVRLKIIDDIQQYINKNDIYRVIFGHYDESYKWIPLKTEKINLREVFYANDNGNGE